MQEEQTTAPFLDTTKADPATPLPRPVCNFAVLKTQQNEYSSNRLTGPYQQTAYTGISAKGAFRNSDQQQSRPAKRN